MTRHLYPIRPGLGGSPKGGAVGVQGFVSSTNLLQTAVGQILPGSAGGFYCATAVHVLSVPSGVQYPFVSVSGVSDGWTMATVGAGAALYIRVGGGTTVAGPAMTIAAGDIGKVVLLVGVFDATGNLVRSYRTGAQVGAGTAMGGNVYVPCPVGGRASAGAYFNGTSAAVWARIVGALYGTGIPTPADILAHYNACKAANTMESMGGGVTNVNRWQAKDNIPNAATWVDDISGMVLTKTGTLSSVIFNPTWE